MRHKTTMLLGLAVLAIAPTADAWSGADRGGSIAAPLSYTDTFDNAQNAGNWRIHAGGDIYPKSGGNPDWYLRAPELVAPAPALRTDGPSIFTGDYQQRKVTHLGTDLILHFMQWPLPSDTNVHLALRNHAGTPNDSLDDLAVFADSGEPIPKPDSQWRSYEVDIPYASDHLPEGWIAYRAGVTYPAGTQKADDIWQRVLNDVHEVQWSYGGPGSVNLFGLIDAGADNCSIGWQQGWGGAD